MLMSLLTLVNKYLNNGELKTVKSKRLPIAVKQSANYQTLREKAISKKRNMSYFCKMGVKLFSCLVRKFHVLYKSIKTCLYKFPSFPYISGIVLLSVIIFSIHKGACPQTWNNGSKNQVP